IPGEQNRSAVFKGPKYCSGRIQRGTKGDADRRFAPKERPLNFTESGRLGVCRTMRTEAKIRGFENRFQLVRRLIAVAMGQKGAEIWAEGSNLQPVHG